MGVIWYRLRALDSILHTKRFYTERQRCPRAHHRKVLLAPLLAPSHETLTSRHLLPLRDSILHTDMTVAEVTKITQQTQERSLDRCEEVETSSVEWRTFKLHTSVQGTSVLLTGVLASLGHGQHSLTPP